MRTTLTVVVLTVLLGALLWLLRDDTVPPAPAAPPAPPAAAVAEAPAPAPPAASVAALPGDEGVAEANPLALPVGNGFSYRDMLSGIGERLDRVSERLADPMCRSDEHRYRPALQERCAAEDLVLLAELAGRCSYLVETPAEDIEALERAVEQGPWSGSQDAWVEGQAAYAQHRAPRRATQAACDEWSDRLQALAPLSPELPAGADGDAERQRLRPSWLARAAEQGVPLDVGSYSQMALRDMALRRERVDGAGAKRPTRFTAEDYDRWLAEERAVAAVIDGMIRDDPASGVAERVYFEIGRLPEGLAPEQVDFRRLDDGELSEGEAERYREALKYYFAAERLHGESLRDSLYDYAGVARAEQRLHVNDVELARHLGYQLAAELEDGE